MDNGMFYVGLDIGGTKILGALFSESGDIIKREKKKTKASGGAETIIKQIFKVIEALIDGLDNDQIAAIGAGVPGIIDTENGMVVFSPNMAWEKFPLVETIEKKFGIRTFIGNDVNIGTLGEWKYGAGKEYKNIVGIFIGTGIGGGIVINGKLYEGAIGAAGEIGHMNVNPDGPACGCGSRGCLESMASKTAMQREINSQLKRGRESKFREYMAENGEDIIKSEQIKDAYESGDKLAQEIIDDASRYIGVGMASIINIFNPELIILGGGVMESMGDIILPKVEEYASRYSMPKLYENTKFKTAKLGDDAGVFGALSLIKEKI